MLSLLQSQTKATILAPTNAAFETLIENLNTTVEAVLADSQLANILLYHVVLEETILSTDLVDGAIVTAANDQYLSVDLSEGVKFVGARSTASVVQADIEACKMVIHVIDAVLLPVITPETANLEAAILLAPQGEPVPEPEFVEMVTLILD
eukprot:TRINITY_DN3011_c0_g1_i2.p3 TRINITY_DN3011_c0_g1~~TRINITY_DN3011_c0_g1_i2.p3  ORF type:complete len:151 (-),score=21.67 TRINITY_DN3011_c0_g1_i2:352-804(-)